MAYNRYLIKTVGRRKSAITNLELVRGLGQIHVNGIIAEDFFRCTHRLIRLHKPFRICACLTLDAKVKVHGGGLQGQVESLQLALIRSIVRIQPRTQHLFRKYNFFSRATREKERRKYGLKKARKAPQFSKRL
jgi:small subunit ribosomal protein S9